MINYEQNRVLTINRSYRKSRQNRNKSDVDRIECEWNLKH